MTPVLNEEIIPLSSVSPAANASSLLAREVEMSIRINSRCRNLIVPPLPILKVNVDAPMFVKVTTFPLIALISNSSLSVDVSPRAALKTTLSPT